MYYCIIIVLFHSCCAHAAMCKCIWKHSCMSSSFDIAILNITIFFVKWSRSRWSLFRQKICISKTKYNNNWMLSAHKFSRWHYLAFSQKLHSSWIPQNKHVNEINKSHILFLKIHSAVILFSFYFLDKLNMRLHTTPLVDPVHFIILRKYVSGFLVYVLLVWILLVCFICNNILKKSCKLFHFVLRIQYLLISGMAGPMVGSEGDSIECWENYSAGEVLVQGLAGQIHQQDVEAIVRAQKQMWAYENHKF